jgi:hypothetical protein
MVVWHENTILLQVCFFEGVLFILKIRYLQPEFTNWDLRIGNILPIDRIESLNSKT